jgi:hypothetical protein
MKASSNMEELLHIYFIYLKSPAQHESLKQHGRTIAHIFHLLEVTTNAYTS